MTLTQFLDSTRILHAGDRIDYQYVSTGSAPVRRSGILTARPDGSLWVHEHRITWSDSTRNSQIVWFMSPPLQAEWEQKRDMLSSASQHYSR